jgi:hypothetical protein
MINDLYENKDLRKKRNIIWKDLQMVFDSIMQYGGRLTWENGQTEIIYFAAAEFVNNKKSPTEIHIAYRQPFKLPESWKQGDSCAVLPSQEISFSEMETGVGYFKGKTLDTGKIFTIYSMTEETALPQFIAWKSLYNDFANATGHYLAIASPIHSRGHMLIKDFYLT